MGRSNLYAIISTFALAHASFGGLIFIGPGDPPPPPQSLTPRIWTHDGSGSWSTAANWDAGSPNSYTLSANFIGSLSAPNAPAVVNLDGSFSAGGLTFDSPNTYDISGSAPNVLFLGKSATWSGRVEEIPASDSAGPIRVAQGQQRISATMLVEGNAAFQLDPGSTLELKGGFTSKAGSDLTVSGGGTLILSGLQSHSSSGHLRVLGSNRVELNRNLGEGPSGGFGFFSPTHAGPMLEVSGDAQVVLGADQHLASLRSYYQFPGSQSIDLNSPQNGFRSLWSFENSSEDWNKVVKAELHHSIANARDNPGDGIFDSGMRGENSALGVAFLRHPDGPYGFFIRPTVIGDLNLDGLVTISDFIDLASHFGASGSDATWQEGDINYDNAVTISDFIDLASNFGASYTAGTLPIFPHDQQLLSAFAEAHSVPEPASLCLLPLAFLFRRCRHKDLPFRDCPLLR